MNKKDLFVKLRKKFDASTNDRLSKWLGVTPAAISNYQENLTPENVARLIKSARKSGATTGAEFGIIPIVEFFPIEHSGSSQGMNWEIFPSKTEASNEVNQLRDELRQKKGIYLFYNSEYKVIYVGKTEKQKIWSEMKQTFNREIRSYKLHSVNHVVRDGLLETPLSKRSNIKKQQQYLHDSAYYFSAYSVTPSLINNLEAFIVRALVNDLTNTKMERFKYPSKDWHGMEL